MTPTQLARNFGERHPLPLWHNSIMACHPCRPDSAPRLQRLIREQPDLPPKLLALVNSSIYGFPSAITEIPIATSIVGVDALIDLLTALALAQTMSSLHPKPSDWDAFWNHAVSTGLVARHLSRRQWLDKGETAFLCGLFHDVGKLVIHTELPAQSLAIQQRAATSGTRLFEVERDELGFDHTNTGRFLLEAWRLPNTLVAAAGDHHTSEPGQQPMADIVAKANRLAPKAEPASAPVPADPATPCDAQLLEIELQAMEITELLFGGNS